MPVGPVNRVIAGPPAELRCCHSPQPIAKLPFFGPSIQPYNRKYADMSDEEFALNLNKDNLVEKVRDYCIASR